LGSLEVNFEEGALVASNKYIVGRASDLAEGERMIVEVNNRSIGIFNVDGKYFGLANRCPHKGAEMCRGHVVGHLSSSGPGEFEYDTARKYVMCPWHGWEFDVVTGQSYFDPTGVRTRPYAVEVEGGAAVISEVDGGEASYTPGEYAVISQNEKFGLVDEAPVELDGRLPGPYTAETIPITVEDDYLVVNLRPARPARGASKVEETA
jgi:nitrite reductase/ring-hydroxylating ferredoxin subunit